MYTIFGDGERLSERMTEKEAENKSVKKGGVSVCICDPDTKKNIDVILVISALTVLSSAFSLISYLTIVAALRRVLTSSL